MPIVRDFFNEVGGYTKLVSIHILNMNQERFLNDCIKTVVGQTYDKLEIIVTDNGSSKDTLGSLEYQWPHIKFIRNYVNKGYSEAHNEFILNSHGEYLLFLNADITLDNNFVTEMVKAVEKDKNIGLVQGKLYRMCLDGTDCKSLDSTGIVIYKNRRNLDRDHAHKDTKQNSQVDYIFGASGAALFCRRQMLESIKIANEYFDEDFFAYREEVDLAWRAQLSAWKCVYVPTAIAYHYRTYAPDRRKQMPRELKQLQYRNRYLMLIKNELKFTFILHLPYILSFEFVSFIYVFSLEPFLLKTWPEIIKLLPKMLKKRRQIMHKRKVSVRYILSLIK